MFGIACGIFALLGGISVLLWEILRKLDNLESPIELHEIKNELSDIKHHLRNMDKTRKESL